MPKVQCIGGPMDGGFLEFPGKIPNTYRIPSNLKKEIKDESSFDGYYMAEYHYDTQKDQYDFKGYS